MNKISHNENIFNIEVGLLLDNKAFNLKKDKHGYMEDDSVGFGFWINGGQFSGVDFYNSKNGLYGSDMIRK